MELIGLIVLAAVPYFVVTHSFKISKLVKEIAEIKKETAIITAKFKEEME